MADRAHAGDGHVETASAPPNTFAVEMASARDQDFGDRGRGLLGFVVGDRWLPGAGAQSGTSRRNRYGCQSRIRLSRAERQVVAQCGERRRCDEMSLSAADLATLIFRSPRRRQTPVDSIEARIDSLLWIRGRLRGGSRFELGGEVEMSRRGARGVRVQHLTLEVSMPIQATSRVSSPACGHARRKPTGCGSSCRRSWPKWLSWMARRN